MVCLTGARQSEAAIRALDVMGAGAGLILLSPFLLLIAASVKISSRGPALFRSTRLGRNARPFSLYKFRSMREDAPAMGPAITSANDPRITSVGRILRDHKLDELPQLLNVLKGDMSLVGPRPEDPAYVALYSREQLQVLNAKPGMTSLASLEYSDEESRLVGNDWESHYRNEVMPAKLAIDGRYLETRSLFSDIRIVVDTLSTLAGLKRPAHSDG